MGILIKLIIILGNGLVFMSAVASDIALKGHNRWRNRDDIFNYRVLEIITMLDIIMCVMWHL